MPNLKNRGLRMLAAAVLFAILFSYCPVKVLAEEPAVPSSEKPNLIILEPYPTYLVEVEGQRVLIDVLGFVRSGESDAYVPVFNYNECFNEAYGNGTDLKQCDPTVELNNPETAQEPTADVGRAGMGARYYDGAYGRFISQDPVFQNIGVDKRTAEALEDPQSLNSYSYAGNNPLRYIDPNGAYKRDVHYDLTAYLAQKSGFSSEQAGKIAYYDQRVDESIFTHPWNLFVTDKYHFALRDNTKAEIEKLLSGNMCAVDFDQKLGALLHTYQDSWSHEGLNWIEHIRLSARGESPDRTYADTNKALEMAEASFRALRDTYAQANGTGGLPDWQYRQQTNEIWDSISPDVKQFVSQDNKADTNIGGFVGLIKKE